jgi:hypothetical protein
MQGMIADVRRDQLVAVLNRWAERANGDGSVGAGVGPAVVEWYEQHVAGNYRNEALFLLYVLREALADVEL